MARTVEDCAFLLQALAGYDGTDPASSRAPVTDYVSALKRGIRGVMVGVPRDYFFESLDAEVETAVEEALKTLRGLGATVREVEIPSIQVSPAILAIMLPEAFAYHERDLREHPERYGDVLREKLLAGALFTASEYVQAQRLRARLCAEMAAVLETVDVLVTPTTRGPASTFAEVLDPDFPFPRYKTMPFNLTGVPALALPCGFSRAGLPLSLQIAGRPFDEATVLRVGHGYEQATGWHWRRPPI
jgi:aspartyl-tRNA(Asn)/glutamyl-tRNA(Gln) amidotransferase subunit A